MRCISNVISIKREISTHEAIQRLFSMPMRHSNNDVVYIPTDVKKIEYKY